MKKTSIILILGVVALVGVLLYTGYLFWEKSSLDSELKKVEKYLVDYKEENLAYENNDVLEAINAKKTIESLDLDSIKWSQVIKDIRKTIPEDKNGKSLVQALSYSGSNMSDIFINVKTNSDSKAPYFDVADLIESFYESKNFVDTFVSSISSGISEEGVQILTFVLNTQYVKESEVDGESYIEEENKNENVPIVR